MVDGLHPGGEQRVQLDHVGELAAGADLDQELVADGAEEPFDLAPPGRLAGAGVDQPDPQRRAGPQQLLVHERRSVVDIDRAGNAAGGQPAPQRGFEPDSVFAAGPPVSGQQSGMIIDERAQDRLPPAYGRAVQRVPGPAHVRGVGLEPAERGRWLPVRAGGEFQSGEMALQGPLVRGPAGMGPQDRGDLSCGPAGHFTLQPGSQLQHLDRGPRPDLPGTGHQCVEPATAPSPDPPVDRGPRHLHRVPERAGMLSGRQITHEPAALPGRQL